MTNTASGVPESFLLEPFVATLCEELYGQDQLIISTYWHDMIRIQATTERGFLVRYHWAELWFTCDELKLNFCHQSFHGGCYETRTESMYLELANPHCVEYMLEAIRRFFTLHAGPYLCPWE